MTVRLRLILGVAWAAGALVVWRALLAPELQVLASAQGAMVFATMLVLAIVSEMKPIPYSFGREGKETSLTISVVLATLFIFGWPEAVLVAAASVAVADVVSNKPYYKILFNASVYVVSAFAAAAALHAASAMLGATTAAVAVQLVGGFAAGLGFYLANVTLLMLVIAEVQGGRLLPMIAWDLRDSWFVTLTLTSIAVGTWLLWTVHPVAAAVLLPPVYMAKAGYQGYIRMRSEAESVLAGLADLLDLRDRDTGKHSLRVSEMAWALAGRLNLHPEQALAVRAIARVHDIGKVVIRDEVLQKPGPLTPREVTEMQTHVEAGGQILSHLSVYQPQLALMLQHHERLDGAGYPLGLRHREIAMGARIIAVCDAYDTMTSDRPYRRAMSPDAAMAELYREAGTQFDPRVVDAFEEWLIEEGKLRPDWGAARLDAADRRPGERRLTVVDTARTVSGAPAVLDSFRNRTS